MKNDKRVILKLKKASEMIVIFGMLNEYFEDAMFKFHENMTEIRCKNNTDDSSIIFYLKLDQQKFEKYYTHEIRVNIAFKLDKLVNFLKLCSPEENLEICIDYNYKLLVTGTDKVFGNLIYHQQETKGMIINEKIESTTHDILFNINMNMFINKLDILSQENYKYVQFVCDNHYFLDMCGTDEIKNDEHKSTFYLKEIHKLKYLSKIINELKIYLSDDNPMMIGLNTLTLGHIYFQYILKTDENEENNETNKK
jgi:hypothetical protein